MTTRRSLLELIAVGAFIPSIVIVPSAQASLVQFPTDRLNNRYILVRAGQSEADGANEVYTNPVWKQSFKSGLSRLGKAQVLKSIAPTLQQLGACGPDSACWLWPSITQSSLQTAEILAAQLNLTRDKLVPEYSFLDARGLGAYEGLQRDVVVAKLQAGDVQDINWHPPSGTDGTPNESVADVLVRMRQVMSVTETQYSDADIVFITPDSDTLSILQAAALGIDLRQHHKLAFRPGEVRVLQLSSRLREEVNTTLACPNPPNCNNA